MKPKISVVLPTYNREHFLSLTLKSIFNQDFRDFEVIVLDDRSTDNTKKTAEAFADKRLRYIKNKQNLGYGLNLDKGFRLSKGKYVFLISDDDLILRSDTFSSIYNEMEKKNVGYAQTGLMYYSSDPYHPSSLDHVDSKLIYIPPSKDVILQTLNWHFGCVSGNVFRRDLLEKNDVIDDVWWPYFRAIYRSILKTGCLYFGHHFIVARISTTGLIKWLDQKVNKGFYMRKLFQIYKEFDRSDERFDFFLKNRLDFLIGQLIGIKYYTSNRNVKYISKEIVKYRPDYIYDLYFWRNVLLALILPKFFLKIVRFFRIKISSNKMLGFVKSINLSENLNTFLKTS